MSEIKITRPTTKRVSVEILSTRSCEPTKIKQNCASCHRNFRDEKWGLAMIEDGPAPRSIRLCKNCFYTKQETEQPIKQRISHNPLDAATRKTKYNKIIKL